MGDAYKPYYPNGWQSGEEGATPITPEALNHFDSALGKHAEALAKQLPKPATAAAGQFLKVGSVDEDGNVLSVDVETIPIYHGETEDL